jgi:hypothetical protein
MGLIAGLVHFQAPTAGIAALLQRLRAYRSFVDLIFGIVGQFRAFQRSRV